jgi:hypothetical protein
VRFMVLWEELITSCISNQLSIDLVSILSLQLIFDCLFGKEPNNGDSPIYIYIYMGRAKGKPTRPLHSNRHQDSSTLQYTKPPIDPYA